MDDNIERIEFEENGITWVTERLKIDGIVYSENTHPKTSIIIDEPSISTETDIELNQDI